MLGRWPPGICPRPPVHLILLYRQILERRGVRKSGDPAERRFSEPRTDAVDEGKFPDRCEYRLLVHELLYLVQDFLALLAVEFGRLLRKQLIDIRIAAIHKGAIPDDV